MHNIFLVCVSDFYYKNKIFDLNGPISRENFLFPYYLLRQEFLKFNVSLNTYDYFKQSCDQNYTLIFFDIPRNIDGLLKYHKDIEKFLVIFESEVISSVNWNRNLHRAFKKVFTWNDEFVDNKKYFKINASSSSSKIPTDLDLDLNKKNKLCTMIIWHKLKSHPLELYTERIKAIRWFEQNHPEDFDLYGMGWDKYCFKGTLSMLNRFEVLTKLLKPKYPSYKGAVKSKREVLRKYKFAICYENARDIPGYITEKIFDCFFASCVPVYWGAPNVTEHIPADTFIDRRDFKSYDELYGYLKNMSDKEYLNYLDAIKNFIRSEKIYPFSAECFADTLTNEILGGHVR